jgi:hypothetical protein
MDIIVFRPHELPIALGALRALVRRPSARQERYLEVIARLHGSHLRALQVRESPPQLTAAMIQDPHRRKRLVQLAVILTTVDGRVLASHAAAVETLAKILEVDEPSVRVLPLLATRRTLAVRVRMMQRILRKLLGDAYRDEGLLGAWRVVSALGGIGRARATEQRFARLSRFPEGSIGRALFDYCKHNGFGLPGSPAGIPERLMFHDIGHLLSGYGTHPDGEIQQAAFQAGFIRDDGFVFLFFGVIQFHLGIKITPVAAPEVGLFDVERVLTALARGAACKRDLSDHWSFWSVADRPIDQVRQSLGVTPLSAAPLALERAYSC